MCKKHFKAFTFTADKSILDYYVLFSQLDWKISLTNQG